METSILDIPVKKITGEKTTLQEYSGKVMLVVNVASECGLTPQYEGLEKIFEKYQDRGFVVLGFPANEFGAQEPGTNSEIQEFCRSKFGIKFPMFEKIIVKGDGQHPLYQRLTQAVPVATEKPGGTFKTKLQERGLLGTHPEDIKWNFEKFLINRAGDVVARFSPDIKPDDPIIIEAIENELNHPDKSQKQQG